MKQYISRNGSECIIRDSKGKLWLTRRKKIKHDSRRRRLKKTGKSVKHFPIKRIMEPGDWLFSCSMNPEQFSHWIDEDTFVTLNGANHSEKNCSLTPISDEYAEFFMKHNLSDLFEIHYNNFELYELAVKKICEIFKINFEGI